MKPIKPIWAAGMMSGTALDGVDAALLRTDGVRIAEFGASAYHAYTDPERATLRTALGAWPGEGAVVTRAAQVIERTHATLARRFTQARVVGFHGQTLAHDPHGRGTHQAGDGTRLAAMLGKPVVWDFRSADVEAGGEGAPLAPAYHLACARWIGADAPIAFLNLGGVGNLTWVDPTHADTSESTDSAAHGALVAFDTGPANAPIDDLVAGAGLGRCDTNGALAKAGKVDPAALGAALRHPFYTRPPPKSLDRGSLEDSLAHIRALPLADAIATLVALVGESVARGLACCPSPPRRVLVSGGGRRNPAVMAALGARIGCPVAPVEQAGLDGDMLEAQAFAFLAVRVLRGLATSFPATTGAPCPIHGGRIAWPRAPCDR